MIKEAITSPNVFIFFILFIIIICIALIIFKPGTSKLKKGPEKPPLPSNYFDKKPSWSDPIPEVIKIENQAGASVSLPGSSICTLYTYENEFNIVTPPHIKNLFSDYSQDLVHAAGTTRPPCIDRTQIMAYYGEHTCIQNKNNTCINQYGNYVKPNFKEKLTVNCGGDIPVCDGGHFSMSFNFEFSDDGSLSKNTKFLSIEGLSVSTKTYEKLKKDNGYYFNQNFFSEDSTITNDNIYVPTFFNDFYKTNSPRQQFKIIRYNFNSDNLDFEASDNGIYAEISHIGLGLYLTASSGYEFQFIPKAKTITSDRIKWIMMPSINLKPNVLPVMTKIVNGNVLNISQDAKNSNFYIPTNLPDGAYPYLPEYKYINAGELLCPTPLFEVQYSDQLKISYNRYGKTGQQLIILNTPGFIPNTLANYQNNNEAPSYPSVIYKALSTGQGSAQSDIDGVSFRITQTEADIPIIKWSKGNPSSNFTYGDLVTDNEVTFETIDPSTLTSIFDDSYFTDPRVLPGVSQFNALNFSNSAKKFKAPTKNGVVSINFDNINYDGDSITPDTYQIYLDNEQTNIPEGSYDDNNVAVLDLVFIKDGDSNDSILQSFIIRNSGSGYTNNQTFDIYKEFLGDASSNITGLRLGARDEEFVYRAVPGTRDNQAGNFYTHPIDITSNGFTINSNGISFANDGTYALNDRAIALTPGSNYSVGEICYINQLDSEGNSTFGNAFSPATISTPNMKLLPSVKVTFLAPISNNPNIRAKYPLTANSALTDPYFPLVDNEIDYNLFDTGLGIYAPSPPQIAFADDNLVEKLIAQNITSADDFVKLLASNKGAGNFVTTIDNIKTIQFRELNYIGVSSFTDLNNPQLRLDVSSRNALNINTQPVLGRFIPYSAFIPPYNPVDNKTGNPRSRAWQQGTNVFFNNNNTQLLPNGLENVYQSFSNISNVPQL